MNAWQTTTCCNRIADDGPDVQGAAPGMSKCPACGLTWDGDEWMAHSHDAVLAQRETHLGGPDDDHYARLGVQPIECVEAWSRTWPAGVAYHLGEAVQAIARCGTKGQAVRDLRKAAWLLTRAANALEAASREHGGK